ncbi:MAG: hypothetical protein NVS4B1_36600 [Ktedonobacteraceae bacterium]
MPYNKRMKTRTNMYLSEQDKEYIAALRKHYNLTSDTAAIRFALKHVADEEIAKEKVAK